MSENVCLGRREHPTLVIRGRFTRPGCRFMFRLKHGTVRIHGSNVEPDVSGIPDAPPPNLPPFLPSPYPMQLSRKTVERRNQNARNICGPRKLCVSNRKQSVANTNHSICTQRVFMAATPPRHFIFSQMGAAGIGQGFVFFFCSPFFELKAETDDM